MWIERKRGRLFVNLIFHNKHRLSPHAKTTWQIDVGSVIYIQKCLLHIMYDKIMFHVLKNYDALIAQSMWHHYDVTNGHSHDGDLNVCNSFNLSHYDTQVTVISWLHYEATMAYHLVICNPSQKETYRCHHDLNTTLLLCHLMTMTEMRVAFLSMCIHILLIFWSLWY